MVRIRDPDTVEVEIIGILARQAVALERIAAALEKPLKVETLR